MKQSFDEVRDKLQRFFETGQDTDFNSAINSLHCKLVNAYPQIPGVRYPLEELTSYAHKLFVATGDEVHKYYQLSLNRLNALEGITQYEVQ